MHAEDADQLMSLDKFGKPVLVAQTASKGQRAQASSSVTPPSPRAKLKTSTSVNKKAKAKPAALDIPQGSMFGLTSVSTSSACRA